MIYIGVMRCSATLTICLFAKFCFCQELQYDEGVFVEKIITKDTSVHRYSIDNTIYKPDRIFLYDYYFTDKNGAIRKLIGDRNSDIENQLYETVDTSFQDVNIIDKIRMTVTDNLKFFLRTDSDYTQTVIKYEYCNKNGNSIASEETGLIENTKNVWVHPPRSFYFKILEINPFPFVRMDSVETWNWPLKVGEFSSNSKWKAWKGGLDIWSTYERLPNQILQTNFGELTCTVVSATASSRIGKSWLKTYFNSKYGFVKLEYTNIDSTQLIMTLAGVSQF
jgi:hypothetical protein